MAKAYYLVGMSQLDLFGNLLPPVEPQKKTAPPRKSTAKAAPAAQAEELSEKQRPRKQQKKEGIALSVLENWVPEKQYYSIGEVAKLFNVNNSHIRFWTNEFELRVRTNKKGDRLYGGEQIEDLKIIYHLVRERGFTLAGAKSKLKAEKNRVEASLNLKSSLQQLKKQLQQLKKHLEE